MPFIVLEGFSGTGKTSLARQLANEGWHRITESAHLIPASIPVADRADTYSDYALFGAALTTVAQIVQHRSGGRVVAEGYFLSDLAYARIRQTLGLSNAYPVFYELVGQLLKDPKVVPDLYIILRTHGHELDQRQRRKNPRDKNPSHYFRQKYYEYLSELHLSLGQGAVVELDTTEHPSHTYTGLRTLLEARHLS